MTLSRTSRRAGVLVATVVAAAVVLTACSTGENPPASDATPTQGGSSLLPPAEGNTEYPLTLTTAWGETVLEERPERIAVFGTSGGTEELIALGVTPVGIEAANEREIWTMEALPGEIEEVYATAMGEPLPYEQIAASAPDLIVYLGDDLSESFERLASIAPVLGSETEEPQTDWRTGIVSIGYTLDLADAADAAIAAYDAFFEEVRAENPEFQELTASYLILYGEEYGTTYSSAPGTNEHQFLRDLGFAPNPLAEQFAEFAPGTAVSPELMSQVDADVIILANAGYPDQFHLLTDDPLFQQLGAAQNDRVAMIDAEVIDGVVYYSFDGEQHEGAMTWATGHGGQILGKRWAAEQLVPILRSTLGLG